MSRSIPSLSTKRARALTYPDLRPAKSVGEALMVCLTKLSIRSLSGRLLASGVRRRSIDNGDAVSGKIEVVRPDLVFYRHDETPRFLGEAKYAFTEARRKMGEQIDSITAAQLEAYQAFSATIRDNADPHEIATRWRVLVDTVAETETFGHFCKSAHRSLEAWDRYVADVAAEQSLGLLA